MMEERGRVRDVGRRGVGWGKGFGGIVEIVV
jgi:hypothetical protein